MFFSVHLVDEDKKSGYQFYPGTGDKDDMKHNIINVPLAPMWREKEVSEAIKKTSTDDNTSSSDINSGNGNIASPLER